MFRSYLVIAEISSMITASHACYSPFHRSVSVCHIKDSGILNATSGIVLLLCGLLELLLLWLVLMTSIFPLALVLLLQPSVVLLLLLMWTRVAHWDGGVLPMLPSSVLIMMSMLPSSLFVPLYVLLLPLLSLPCLVIWLCVIRPTPFSLILLSLLVNARVTLIGIVTPRATSIIVVAFIITAGTTISAFAVIMVVTSK